MSGWSVCLIRTETELTAHTLSTASLSTASVSTAALPAAETLVPVAAEIFF